MRRIVKEAPLATFHKDVGAIWRSRNDEPETEIFISKPTWMPELLCDKSYLIETKQEAHFLIDLLLDHTKEKKVIQMIYLLDLTIDEVAQACGLSYERIRQIERKALFKLRKVMQLQFLYKL